MTDKLSEFLNKFLDTKPDDKKIQNIVETEINESNAEELRLEIKKLNFKVTIWSENEFILSHYQLKYNAGRHTHTYKMKMKESEELDLCNIKPKTLAKSLTLIDLNLMKKVRPIELLAFQTGKLGDCNNLDMIEKKNKYLAQLLTRYASNTAENRKFNINYLINVAKYLIKFRNYLSLKILIVALKSQILDKKQREKLVKYDEAIKWKACKRLLYERDDIKIFKQTADFILLPYDFFLRCLHDSNVSPKSELASKTFNGVVDYITELQKFDPKCKKHKIEHFLILKMFQAKEYNNSTKYRPSKKSLDSFWLFLE